jgi:hypothetical protein
LKGEENKMPIIKQVEWKSWEVANQDPYGKCCVDVARQVMKILDEEPGDFDTHKIICRADNEINAGGITGFMAGCVAEMISQVHSHGEEFRRKWNKDNQIKDEGDKANESVGVLNPALLTISV